MSDLLVDAEAVGEFARRVERVAEALAGAPASSALARAADAMPGSRTEAVVSAVARSWSGDETAVIARQRDLAAGVVDALTESGRADAELAGTSG